MEVTAGSLSSVLTEEEINSMINLTLTGAINAWDIMVIDRMKLLTYLDISQVNITATTMAGANYPDNWFPGPGIGKNSMNAGGISLPLLTTIKLPNTLEVIGSRAFTDVG